MVVVRKFGTKVYKWDVPDLHVAAEGLEVQRISADQFNLDVDAWFGEACKPTIKNVLNHMKRIQRADLEYPILLSAEGHVLDGLHRLARCSLEGIGTIKCKQFQRNPEPCEIIDFEAFKRCKPMIAATLVWMEENGL